MTIESAAPRRHHVVLIGSGFGGLFAARHLKRADVDVTLISNTSSHLFQPLLYQVATGILSVGEIAPTTRLILRKHKNTQVLLGDVIDIDLTANTVTSELIGRRTVTSFDSLIVAAGAQQSYFGHDEFADYAPGMKTIDDALELRGRILSSFEQAELATDPAERARLLTFVVVGAGPTGVELAGQIAELADRTLIGAFRHIDTRDTRVILLDAAPAVLPPMGREVGPQGAASAREDGRRDSAQRDGHQHRRRRHRRQGAGRHRAPHRRRVQGVVGRRAGQPAGQDACRPVRRHRGRPGRPGGRRTRPHHQGLPQRLRGRRPDVGAGRSRPGAGRHPGREVRDQAHPGPLKGQIPSSVRRSSTSTRARWPRCRGSARSRRWASSSSAASSPGSRGWRCTCTTWSAIAAGS